MNDLIDLAINVAAFVVAIGTLVAIHEFGHFWVARKLGFKVLRFSIGFGQPLWLRRGRDGVEYVLAAVPLGGFVKMLDEREGPVAPDDAPLAYNRQAIWKRALVLVAGPAANLLAAVLLFWTMLVVGIPSLRPIIGTPSADSPIADARLVAGTEIIAVDGQATATWEGAALALLDAVLAGAPATRLSVRAPDGAESTVAIPLSDHRGLTEPGVLLQRLGVTRWRPDYSPVVRALVPGGAAERAGLQVDDELLAVAGREVRNLAETIEVIKSRPGLDTPLRLRRAGAVIEVTATLSVDAEEGLRIGRIGAELGAPQALIDRANTTVRYGVLESVPDAVARTFGLSRLTLRMLSRMLTGDASLSNISGPINIAQYAGLSASSGLITFLGFLAVISVSLGVLNLLPIPVLDGGQLVFLAVEGATGRPISPAVEAVGQQLGVLLLVGLMGLAFYNDIARLLA